MCGNHGAVVGGRCDKLPSFCMGFCKTGKSVHSEQMKTLSIVFLVMHCLTAPRPYQLTASLPHYLAG